MTGQHGSVYRDDGDFADKDKANKKDATSKNSTHRTQHGDTLCKRPRKSDRYKARFEVSWGMTNGGYIMAQLVARTASCRGRISLMTWEQLGT